MKININKIKLNIKTFSFIYENEIIISSLNKLLFFKIEKAIEYMQEGGIFNVDIKQGIFLMEFYILLFYSKVEDIEKLIVNYINDDILNEELDKTIILKKEKSKEKDMSTSNFISVDNFKNNILEIYALYYEIYENKIPIDLSKEKNKFKKSITKSIIIEMKAGKYNKILNILDLNSIKEDKINTIIDIDKYIMNIKKKIQERIGNKNGKK
jgi:hypothetical protein